MPADGVPGVGMTVDSPFQIAGESKVRAQPAPAVGQHSDEILRANGYGAEAIERLRRSGVVA